MNTQVMTFENQEFGKVRTVEISGEPWLVGKDVAEALGYSNGRDAISKHVDADDKGVAKCDTLGGKQDLQVINESGMYSLVISSKLPGARKFKRWITSEVLPSIRKHGAYMTPEKIEEVLLNPDVIIRLATELKEERQKVLELKPKADFYDTVANSDSLLSMADVAKVLDKGIGRNRLFKLLRSRGILQGNNVPYQRFVDAGYFKVVESSYMAGDNAVVSTVTYVKQKGVDYIRKLLEE